MYESKWNKTGMRDNSMMKVRAYFIFLDELPFDDVINEILMTHETIANTFQQPRQINSSLLDSIFDPRLDSVEHYLFVFNIKLVVAQYCFQLVAKELLELRALFQYLLEMVTYVLPALFLEVAAEIVACEFEDTCRVNISNNGNYF